MPSVNRVILIGNITRDPQLKYLPNGTAVCEFGLAMNDKCKTKEGEQRESVCFVDCAMFGKGGEVINQYMTKGRPLYVEGKLSYSTWEDKQGGGKRHKLSVIVENFQFLGDRRDDGDGRTVDPSTSQDLPAPRRSVGDGLREKLASKPRAETPFGEEQQFREAEIPF